MIAGTKCLIVNADDFGQSPGVNRGIIRAHEHGIVTSASLMVRWPAAYEAAEYARSRPELGLGLHVDFGEWMYRSGEWVPLYEVVVLEDSKAVQTEVDWQLDRFHQLTGRDPDHIDSHQHFHTREEIRPIFEDVARRLGASLRTCGPTVRYCGEFYGQTAEGEAFPEGITLAHLAGILQRLDSGFTELSCHPAEDADLNTMYREERRQELAVLCDPAASEAVNAAGVELCSFSDLAAGEKFWRKHGD